MKKHNAGNETVTEQRSREVKAARRDRRKTKRNEILSQKIKPLLVKIGALQTQINNLEKEKNLERLEERQGQAGSVADTASSPG